MKRDVHTQVAIVDDDASLRRAMLGLCKAYSFRAKAYASARDFLESLQTDLPDCLILDSQLPEMNGLQLLNQLTASGPRIPTLVITGNDRSETRRQYELAGASAFLLKPVDVETLVSTIRAVMTGSDHNAQTATSSP